MSKPLAVQHIIASLSAIGIAGTAAPALAGSCQERTRLTIEQRGGSSVYCLREKVTGSLVMQKTCLSRAQWEDQGLQFESPTADSAVSGTLRKANKSDTSLAAG